MTEKIIESNSVEDTWNIAEALARDLPRSATLALHGDLGSGKTCFVNGIARALDISGPITSPTFTIINEYSGNLPLYHMDLYRLSCEDELFSLDLNRYFTADGIKVIEWAERAGNLLPPDTINIDFKVLDGEDRRLITIKPPPAMEITK